jgi:hypothetical protein
MGALLLSLLLLPKPDSLRLSLALYAFGAASDELTSRGKQETGMVSSTRDRIALKAALLPVYLVVTHQASKSEHRWVRRMGTVARWGVPAMFLGGGIHNLTVRGR